MISLRSNARTSQATLTYQDLHQVVVLLRQVEEAMRDARYPEKDVFAVRLALDEALVNAIRHGHQFDPGKRALFRFAVTADRVWAEIEDEGPGFCPHDVPDPLADDNLEKTSGRGLLLMKAYMTSVTYNERGNRVTLCKHRTPD